MQDINFPDANDIVFKATLDGTVYRLRMLWNPSGRHWTLGLRTEDGTALLDGIKVVPNYPLLRQYNRPDLPPGEIMAITQDDSLAAIGRNEFTDGKVILTYVPEDEVNAI